MFSFVSTELLDRARVIAQTLPLLLPRDPKGSPSGSPDGDPL